ncbi:UNVERIFIED_CONTAM: Guanine nucleotide-binding protein subunit alpha-14 [Siphonaria sp. JEL0065]|nr:Guanine nucleotide-binding protein subunit alpha-14 [Siphonaria sp. JEL0065]
MGNLCSSDPSQETSQQREVNSVIDKQLEAERKALKNIVKLLILGPGESGKSTILKQFRLIYGAGFSEDDRATFRSLIIVNIVQCAKTLVSQMEVLQIPYGFNPEDHAAAVAATPATLERPSGAAESMGSGAGELAVGGLTPAKLSAITRDSEMGSLQQGLGLGAPSIRQTGMGSTGAISAKRRGTGTESSGVLDRRDGNHMGSTTSHDSGLVRPSHSSIHRKVDPMAVYASKQYREFGDKKLGDVAKVVKIVEELKIGFGHLGNAEIPPQAIEAIGKVWKDPGIQYCFRRANEFQLIDTCP